MGCSREYCSTSYPSTGSRVASSFLGSREGSQSFVSHLRYYGEYAELSAHASKVLNSLPYSVDNKFFGPKARHPVRFRRRFCRKIPNQISLLRAAATYRHPNIPCSDHEPVISVSLWTGNMASNCFIKPLPATRRHLQHEQLMMLQCFRRC